MKKKSYQQTLSHDSGYGTGTTKDNQKRISCNLRMRRCAQLEQLILVLHVHQIPDLDHRAAIAAVLIGLQPLDGSLRSECGEAREAQWRARWEQNTEARRATLSAATSLARASSSLASSCATRVSWACWEERGGSAARRRLGAMRGNGKRRRQGAGESARGYQGGGGSPGSARSSASPDRRAASSPPPAPPHPPRCPPRAPPPPLRAPTRPPEQVGSTDTVKRVHVQATRSREYTATLSREWRLGGRCAWRQGRGAVVTLEGRG